MEQTQHLPVPEDRALSVAWGTGPRRDTPAGTLADLIRASALRHADRPALVCGSHRQSYAQFAAAAEMIAQRLRHLGAGPGTTVAVCLARGPALPVALTGVLFAGAAYVPLDPTLPPARVRELLRQVEPVAAVAEPDTHALLGQTPCLDVHQALGQAPAGPGPLAVDAGPGDLAYVLFTSGSTGRPKGVCVEQHSVVDFVTHNAAAYDIRPGTRVLAAASASVDVSVAELFTALTVGATTILATDADKETPQALSALLRRARIEVAELPPALLAHIDPDTLPDLRLVSIGGEAPAPAQVCRWVRSGRRVVNAYGPTEATVTATLHDCAELDPTDVDVPIGRPMANHRVYVLDDVGALAAPGEVGELAVAGPGVARGYLGDPEGTAARFRADPVHPGARMYLTGDLARWDELGRLRFLGRRDGQVNVRGHRIEPGEIEARLRSHPRIGDAAVVVDGEGADTRLVAYLVPRSTESADGSRQSAGATLETSVSAWVSEYLPAHLCPAVYRPVDALPLAATGKVDRTRLASVWAAAVGSPPRPGAGPGDALEHTILTAWRAVLPAAESCGVHDHFVELGGTSLTAMVLLAHLRDQVDVEVKASDLAAHATVAGLATALRARRVGDAGLDRGRLLGPRFGIPAPVDPATDQVGPVTTAVAPAPASPSQFGVWYAEQLDPGTSTFHLPMGYRIIGPLDVPRFRQALGEVARRHGMLRAAYRPVSGSPVPTFPVRDDIDLPLRVLDYGDRGPQAATAAVQAACDELLGTPFDLTRPPLWRAALIRLGEQDHVFALAAHHAICDGWSLSIVTRDLGVAYAGESLGPEPGADPTRPGPPLTYGDVAATEWEWLSGPQAQARAEAWQAAMAGAPERLELPTDRLRPPVVDHTPAAVATVISATLAGRVHALAAEQGVSVHAVLLTAYALVLGRLGATEEVVVSVPVAQRTHPALVELVGMLVAPVPVRVPLGPPDTPVTRLLADCAAAVHEATDLHLPFDRIVQAVGPVRDPGRAALTQVGFNLLNYPAEELRLPGMHVEEFRTGHPGALLDLTCYLRPLPDGGWDLEAVYRPDLFDEARIRMLLDAYLGVLRGLIDRPEGARGALSLRTPAAERLLPDDTQPLAITEVVGVLERFRRSATDQGHREALDGTSYAALAERVGRLGRALNEARVRPGDVVCVPGAARAEYPVALLGILAAGAVAHLLDPAQPAERQRQAVGTGGGRTWLPLSARDPLPSWLGTDWRVLPDVGALVDSISLDRPLVHRVEDPHAPAFVLTTSGSEGTPKAVVSSSAPLAHFVQWYAASFGLGPGDRFALTAGVGHDPVLRDVLVPLSIGASVHIPTGDVGASPQRLLSWLAAARITVLHLTPQKARLLAAASATLGVPLRDLGLLAIGGDVLRGRDLPALRRLAPAAMIVSAYGATETPQFASWQLTTGEEIRERVPLGRGIPGTQLLVVTDAGVPAGIGEPGQVFVRSRHLALGYADGGGDGAFQDEGEGIRRYRTGDSGRYLPDGRVEYLGRRDGAVKVAGHRVDPWEVTTALRELTGVADAAVLPRCGPDGETRLVAFAVREQVHGSDPLVDDPATAASPTEQQVRTLLRGRVVAAAIPTDVYWVPELPLTGNGKLDTDALARLADSRRSQATRAQPKLCRQPDASTTLLDVVAGAGRGTHPEHARVERTVLEQWCRILHRDDVGLDDNFFDAGGTSLQLMEVRARLCEALEQPVSIVDLFQHPTVRTLAAHLHTRTGPGARPGTPGATPPSATRQAVRARRRRRGAA